MTPPLILLTNDDGVEAPGLLALANTLSDLGEVWVVAPEREQSATSHSLTLHKPLRILECSPHRFACSGTPTDCVTLGVRTVVPRPPAIIVSGINNGPNLADDVSYSGTVSAALEAAMIGFPAVAFSRLGSPQDPFDDAARIAYRIVQRALEYEMPERSFWNVNIPNLPLEEIPGLRVTRLGERRYSGEIGQHIDPRGRPYYWIGGKEVHHANIPGSDCNAVDEGLVSLTPLRARYDLPEQENPLRATGLESIDWSGSEGSA